MGKSGLISEITTILAIALRHKIGSIVNENEIYANKYAKDAEVLLNQARKLIAEKNWNNQDKQKIRKQTRAKLEKELKERAFIDNKKFEIMDKELERVLREFGFE